MSLPDSDRRGTLIALEPRIRAKYHQLYHEIAERRELSGSAKVVYAVLCSYHNMFDTVFPGRERLSRDTGEPPRSLSRYINELKAAKLLSVERRGLGQTNVYTLLVWPRGWAKVANQAGQNGPSELAGLASHIPIEEEGLEEQARTLMLEEQDDPAALWTRTLAELRAKMPRTQMHAFEGTRGLRLDDETLVVAGPAELNRKWSAYLRGTLGRAVRFES